MAKDLDIHGGQRRPAIDYSTLFRALKKSESHPDISDHRRGNPDIGQVAHNIKAPKPSMLSFRSSELFICISSFPFGL